MKGQKIVVWFSCGAASAVAAKLTIDKYGRDNEVIICNTPIKEEDEDNRRFLQDVQTWLGQEIFIAINPKYPDCSAVTVWEDRQYISGIKGAPCTYHLKKEARYYWTEMNKPDWHVLGFTFEEQARHNRFVITEIPNLLPVLIEAKITKENCYEIIEEEAGIQLPAIYKMGYNNANCVGCGKANSPTYWNTVRVTHPNVFTQRAIQSRQIGARLVRVKGKRIFLDELDPKAKGRPLKKLKSVECGIFCEVPIK